MTPTYRTLRWLIAPLALSFSSIAPRVTAQDTTPATPTTTPPPEATPTATPKKKTELSKRHKYWLEDEVVWIISDYERDAFLSLPDKEARDRFIDAFWLARDPAPGTRENEFKIEHYKRIADANRLFGRNKKRPGSKSIRGKYWIQLGQPVNRSSYPMERRMYPVEHWFYHGGKSKGLPPFFSVVFYQPYGAGAWELYDPTLHGPEKLLGGGQTSGFSHMDPSAASGRREALAELERVSPDLRRASLSLDPSESADFDDGIPSQSSRRLVAKLTDLSNHLPVDKKYVERVLHGQPEVTVEYSFKQLGMRGSFLGGFMPGGPSVVQYAIEIPPESLTLERYKNTIGGALQVVGRVFEADGVTPVLQIDEYVEIRLTPQELARVQSFPLAFEDIVPLLPGKYRANLVVRNPVTREFGVVDGHFEVPARIDDRLTVGPLLVPLDGKPVEADVLLPFRLGDHVWYPAHDNALYLGLGEMIVTFQVAYPTDSYQLGERIDVRWALLDDAPPHAPRLRGETYAKLNPVFDSGLVTVLVRARLGDLPRGNYTLRVIVEGKNGDRSKQQIPVIATSGPPPKNPWVLLSDRRLQSGAIAMSFAEQHLARGEDELAITQFRSALGSRRQENQARLRLAEILLGLKRYREAEEAIAPLATGQGRSAYALLMLGLARSGAGEADGAVAAFEQALLDSPRNVRVLNVLAEEHARADRTATARELFERSLQMDPEQREIRERLAQLQTPQAP